MARRRLRLTVFARFIIAMLIVAPLAYMGASYYNGEDGVENLKKLFGFDEKEKTETISNPKEERSDTKSTVNYEDLLRENKVLKDSLKSKEQQIYKLKQRIIDLQMKR